MSDARTFRDFPRRSFVFEGNAAGPLWTRLPRPEDARAYELADGLLLLQSEDIKAVLRDPRFVQWHFWALERNPQADPRFVERCRQRLISMEGAEHARLRRLTGPALSSRAMASYREQMRSLMSGLVAKAARRSGCEAVAALCRPYPIAVICAVMGVPPGDVGFFEETAEAWMSAILGGPADVPRSMAAHEKMDVYLKPLVDERRTRPGGDDMLSLLLRTEEEGDRLTRDDITRLIAGLLVAGTETARQGLANALYLFSRHPEQWKMLAENPALALAAVDEVLRFLPPATVVTRVSHEAVDVNGIEIPAYTKVYACLIAANHDSRIYANPGCFDITRPPGPAHYTFGYGRHACAGVHLARAELQEALVVLSQSMTGLALGGEIEWQSPETWQGPRRLPIRFKRR